MKIGVFCNKCAHENAEPIKEYLLDFKDENLYTLRCERGHETVTRIQENKFELLFELGMHAILDGYYRDAVVSFTTALERFYEFYVRVIAAKYEIKGQDFSVAWKIVNRQSERQFGAYIFMYLLENKKAPPMLSEGDVKFRNDVVHNGRVPTKNEAKEYGQGVINVIIPVLNELKVRDSKFILDVEMQRLQELKTKNEDKDWVFMTVMTMPTILSTGRIYDANQFNINNWLEQVVHKHRKRHINAISIE
jgi:hypothetical protein